MEKYLSILTQCELFYGISPENIQAMLGCLGARVDAFKKGTAILAEGSPAKYLGIVLSGSAQIVRVDYYGTRSIVVCLGPTQIFGESFACAGVETMPVDVIADKDTTALIIDLSRITHSCTNACEFHSQIIFNLLKLVANKNLVFNEKIEIISKRSTREKLLTYLLAQAKLQSSASITIPLDRQGLADYLGVERSGLSMEISKLRKEGILECSRNCFVIK